MQFPFKYNKMGRTTNGHYMINGGYMNLWRPIHVHTRTYTHTRKLSEVLWVEIWRQNQHIIF